MSSPWVGLLVGALTAAVCAGIGVTLGLIAGFYGGRVELILGRLVDAVLAVPSILLALGLAAVFRPSPRVIVFSLGLVWWVNYARVVRGEALVLRKAAFVEAGQAIGCSDLRLLTRYLWPNVAPLVLVLASLTVASAIIVEASLSFLGVGVQPPTPSWGPCSPRAGTSSVPRGGCPPSPGSPSSRSCSGSTSSATGSETPPIRTCAVEPCLPRGALRRDLASVGSPIDALGEREFVIAGGEFAGERVSFIDDPAGRVRYVRFLNRLAEPVVEGGSE